MVGMLFLRRTAELGLLFAGAAFSAALVGPLLW